MTRAEAEAECRRLTIESPERETHRWVPRDQGDGEWSVVKIALRPATEPESTTRRADERPPMPADPRPDVPPWVGPV
jgi:hypothetical protein